MAEALRGVKIIALDPGTTETGWCVYEDGKVTKCGINTNQEMLRAIANFGMHPAPHLLAIEWIEAMGMAVGREVFETCRWVGRFQQACGNPDAVRFVTRREVKLHLCGNMRAKDPNIRQALLDKLGPVGTKKEPGPCFGVKSHIWSALAVAVTAAET